MAEWADFVQRCRTDATNLAESYLDDYRRVLACAQTGAPVGESIDPSRGINFAERIAAAAARAIDAHVAELQHLQAYKLQLDERAAGLEKRAARIAAREQTQRRADHN